MENVIHFKSCFICEVNIGANEIELVDFVRESFFIDKNNEELMKVFKSWFVNVYKACIPQTLTVVQYEIASRNDEPMMRVQNLIYNVKRDCMHSLQLLNEKEEHDA